MKIKLPEMNKIAKANNLTFEELNERISVIKAGMDPLAKRIPVIENGVKRYYSVERRGVGPIKTALGEFW